MAGFGAGLGAASPYLAQADRRSGLPMQGTEYHLELTYQIPITPWFMLQPDIQASYRPVVVFSIIKGSMCMTKPSSVCIAA